MWDVVNSNIITSLNHSFWAMQTTYMNTIGIVTEQRRKALHSCIFKLDKPYIGILEY